VYVDTIGMWLMKLLYPEAFKLRAASKTRVGGGGVRGGRGGRWGAESFAGKKKRLMGGELRQGVLGVGPAKGWAGSLFVRSKTGSHHPENQGGIGPVRKRYRDAG